jgi:hypothetical protein
MTVEVPNAWIVSNKAKSYPVGTPKAYSVAKDRVDQVVVINISFGPSTFTTPDLPKGVTV